MEDFNVYPIDEFPSRRQLNFEDIHIQDSKTSEAVVVEENIDITEGMGYHIDNSFDDDEILNETHVLNHSQISEEFIPKEGMNFSSELEAHKFYNSYAKLAGFGTKKGVIHKDKKTGIVLDRTFFCSRQGYRPKDKRDLLVKSHRAETRCGCKAMMKISCRSRESFRIVQFVSEHNHGVVSPSKAHRFRSHRMISEAQAAEIDSANNVGICPRHAQEMMSMQVGGREHLGFIPTDYKNYLRSKRTETMKIGDTGGVLEYLQKMQLEDPNFSYSIQVDEDDLITNIFWADAKMRADYSYFGDVVCFDTTYKKNKEGRPLALFVGVNNHKQTIVFGAALLYDETIPTFEWLFETFVKVMLGKKPKTMLTDQCQAMATALSNKWDNTVHRLCVWHISQNAASNLSHVFASNKEFSKDFSSCVYDYENEVDFIEAWNQMLEKYNLQDNDWLKRLFSKKEKWALVYGRQTFCADMTTTQRSESMNSVVKRYVSYKNHLLEFFNHFQKLLESRRYDEATTDFKGSQSTPVIPLPVKILYHAASVYTHEVFEMFKIELGKSYDCQQDISSQSDSKFEYKVTPFGKKYHHVVTYDLLECSITCSCKKFEFTGILCSHALKVLGSRNIVEIPKRYILKRWTNIARKTNVKDYEINSTYNPSEGDSKGKMVVRYKELCHLNMQLVTKAAQSEKAHKIAKEALLRLMEQVDDIISGKNSGDSPTRQPAQQEHITVDECVKIKGVKVKEKVTYKTSKRRKSALETAISKRVRRNSKSNTSEEIGVNGNEISVFRANHISEHTGNMTTLLQEVSQGSNIIYHTNFEKQKDEEEEDGDDYDDEE